MKRLERLTILYVEDEKGLLESYTPFLEECCQTLYTACNGEEAYQIYKKSRPNIILLDMYLPKMSGVELAKKIRYADYTTILIAFTGYSDKKILLELIDLYFLSYLIKPVSRSQLIESLVKASQRINSTQQVHLPCNCSWDVKSKTLFFADKQVAFTKRELSFFELMVEKQGVPASDEEILFHVWNDKFEQNISNTSIRTLVKNIRKKLPKGLIKNQYGLGYKIDF